MLLVGYSFILWTCFSSTDPSFPTPARLWRVQGEATKAGRRGRDYDQGGVHKNETGIGGVGFNETFKTRLLSVHKNHT